MRHHVPAANRATEERQDAPLLERRREQASRRRRGGAEARSVFGRDQFVPGGGVAQGDRGVRRGRRQLSDAGLVPGGPLRGRGGRRLGGAAANFGNAPASSATVGRLLVAAPPRTDRVAALATTGPPTNRRPTVADDAGAFPKFAAAPPRRRPPRPRNGPPGTRPASESCPRPRRTPRSPCATPPPGTN